MIKYPDWFKFETGFRFLDNGGDECVFLGEAGFRETTPLGHLNLHATKEKQERSESLWGITFMPKDSWVMVYKYKNEWSFTDLKRGADYNQEWWDSIRSIPHKGSMLDPAEKEDN